MPKSRGAHQLIHQSLSSDWWTPEMYLKSVREVIGEIELDPASSEEANVRVRAQRFFAERDNGLVQPWRAGSVWCNPPYGGVDGTKAWVNKMLEEYRFERFYEGILLVNSATDRSWFQPLFAYPLCFTDHRIRFDRPDGGKADSPTNGNAFVYFGHNTLRFVNVFSRYGAIVRRVI